MASDDCTHYWVIDSNNVGHCRYCGEVRDFGKLLTKQGVFAGRRGDKARKEIKKRRQRRSRHEGSDDSCD